MATVGEVRQRTSTRLANDHRCMILHLVFSRLRHTAVLHIMPVHLLPFLGAALVLLWHTVLNEHEISREIGLALVLFFVLFIFGSGPVRGFSVTLAIGIVTSMFTAIMVTRLMVVLWLRRGRKARVLPI